MNRQKPILKTATFRYALFGFLFGLLFPISATLTRMLATGQPVTFSTFLSVQSEDSLLWIIDTAPIILSMFAGFAGYRQDLIEQSNKELLRTEKELRDIQITLEQRVEQRTLDLTIANQKANKRAEQLEIIAEIARSVLQIQNMDELLREITKLIGARFGFYHSGIFLVDESGQYAIFQASNSEGGQKMLARGHRLKVGEQGIVGFVTYSGKPRVAQNVGNESVFFTNPDLPDTLSEIAIPLKYGQETIGALDIQSEKLNAFSQEDIDVFSILANQVAIAIQNTRAREQAQRALQEMEITSRQTTAQTWEKYGETLHSKGYRYDGVKSEPLKKAPKANEHKDAITVPVQLRGQTIGLFRLRASDTSRNWTSDELSIIDSTAERVALAIDGARLLNEAQKRAARETLISEISTKISASFQLDSILRDTVEELGHTFKDTTVTFQLVNPSAPPVPEKDDNKTSRRNKSE